MRFLNMAEMVELTGISRFTLAPALQRGELHGSQRVKRGNWRAEESCVTAWMLGEKCDHQKTAAA